MQNNKETGSYYTPHELIDFMVNYLKKNRQNFENVLEPSAGDGRFLSVLLSECNRVKAIELFEQKVHDIQKCYSSSKLIVQKENFLDYAKEAEERYSLIIGNPPYISPKNMDKKDITKAKELCQMENLDVSAMQNMWLAFVVGASRLLMEQGTIFFVLPMEFLQVQYAEKLRIYLESKFNTIHIISFQAAIFPEIEQDICLVYMTNRNENPPYILYEIYEEPTSVTSVYENIIKKSKPLKKWSNAILSDDSIALLKKKSANYKSVKELGVSAPGIVTGANKYFILTEADVQKYKCENYVLPILQKSSYILENTIKIDEGLFENLKKSKKPVFLLDLSNVKEDEMPVELKAYLDWAKEQKVGDTELIKRYKCANRKPWYGVPIVNKGDVVFFKRYHLVPRVYMNCADIHTTDAGYHIRLEQEWKKENVVFCFYNSLTLAQCEFQGRYYGGGVSELVPSEFKELPIPYQEIDENDIEKLDEMFRKNVHLDEIVAFVNERTICRDMDKNDIAEIEQIRKRLVQRRLSNI